MNAKVCDVHVANGEGAAVPPSLGQKVPEQRKDSPRYPVTLVDAAAICHGPFELDEIELQRAIECKEDALRERDDDRGDLMGAKEYE